MIVVPSKTLCWMSGRSVAASRLLFGHWTRMQLPGLPRSTIPRYHFPSTYNPLWYFLCINFDSSISTSTPGPPIGWRLSSITAVHMSRQFEFQLTLVSQVWMSNSLCTTCWGVLYRLPINTAIPPTHVTSLIAHIWRHWLHLVVFLF